MAKQQKPFKLTYPDPGEDDLQASIVHMFEAILPKDQVLWTHIAHGGYELTPKARGRLMRLGLKRGFPDLLLAYDQARILWLEIKTHSGILSPDQRLNHALLKMFGHAVEVCRSLDDAIMALIRHGVPHRRNSLSEEYYAKIQSRAAPGDATQSAQGGGGIVAASSL